MSQPFPPKALRRRHAQTVRDSSSSYEIDYVIAIRTFLNPKGHQNLIRGSKVMAILLKGRILPIGVGCGLGWLVFWCGFVGELVGILGWVSCVWRCGWEAFLGLCFWTLTTKFISYSKVPGVV